MAGHLFLYKPGALWYTTAGGERIVKYIAFLLLPCLLFCGCQLSEYPPASSGTVATQKSNGRSRLTAKLCDLCPRND